MILRASAPTFHQSVNLRRGRISEIGERSFTVDYATGNLDLEVSGTAATEQHR
jgi:hypothetical protein